MRVTKTAIARAAAILGLAAFAVGILADGTIDHTDLRAIGLAWAIASLMWFFVSRGRRSEDEIYRAGRREGYDEGWDECARIARPSPVVSVDKLQRRAANDS